MDKSRLTIRNEEQLMQALEGAEELAGCTNGSDDEIKLEQLADAIDVYTQSMLVLRMLDAHPNVTDPFACRH